MKCPETYWSDCLYLLSSQAHPRRVTEGRSFTNTTWSAGLCCWLYWWGLIMIYHFPAAQYQPSLHARFLSSPVLFSVSSGQWDRTSDDVVQPAVHSGAGHRHGAVSGDQHRQLEVQIHQSDGEAVEGQRQPGLGNRTLPGYAVTNKVVALSLLERPLNLKLYKRKPSIQTDSV